MKRRQLGLTALFVVVTTALTVLGGIAILQTFDAAGAPSASAAELGRTRNALLLTLIALGAFAVGIAFVAGNALTSALTALRSAVLARARGESGVALPAFSVAPLAGIASAIERLSARDAASGAEIRRESAEVRVLLDATSEGILRLDGRGRVLRANPAARTLLGLGDSALGQPIAAYVRHAELRRLVNSAAAGQPVGAAEITLDDRRLIVSARPLERETDLRGGAVVAFIDLTEVRRLESVRRDFVANVSHELKTPLTSIRGYVETLLSDDDLPSEVQRQFLEVIQKNARRLHHIVDDLLDLSRLESGGWRPEPVDVDAGAMITDVWSGCSTRAAERNVRFTAPAESLHVLADPAGLRQVLTNLLDNALRYTPEGGAIAVRTQSERRGDVVVNGDARRAMVTFQISDTGAGIPSEALPRIFERFYRVDPARSRAEGGTGLGLSIVKHLVERMGGDITAESEIGKGTTVTFRLPATSEQG
ncbi:MAG: ATP-binding protein [Gemmatimonadota bacterium]